MTVASRLRFFGEFVREPLRVGAVWPSSNTLAQVVANACSVPSDGLLVELGPGTGPFTGLLRARVNQGGRFLALEISATNAAILWQRFSNREVILDLAEHLPRYLGGAHADSIVSGLAWGTMLPGTQDRVLQAILSSLRPTGQFIAFGYVHAAWLPTSRRFREMLRERFAHVHETPIVWRNFPPAFVLKCSEVLAEPRSSSTLTDTCLLERPQPGLAIAPG